LSSCSVSQRRAVPDFGSRFDARSRGIAGSKVAFHDSFSSALYFNERTDLRQKDFCLKGRRSQSQQRLLRIPARFVDVEVQATIAWLSTIVTTVDPLARTASRSATNQVDAATIKDAYSDSNSFSPSLTASRCGQYKRQMLSHSGSLGSRR